VALVKICPKQASGFVQNKSTHMKNFILGCIAGLVIASVGFAGIARIFDRGVQAIQNTSKELAQ